MTPFFIKFQKNKKIGERIRIDGPKTHSAKAGTPSMGGLVFVLSSMVAFTIVSLIKYYRHEVYSVEGIFIMSVLLLCSFIGFIDDYIALKMQRSLGLRWWVKISLLAVVCIYFILFSKYILNTGTYLNIPLTNIKIEMGNWYYTIVVLIIISTTNAVNLTDGLDGLATGASSIVLAVFSFIAFLEWSVPDVSVSYAVDVAVVSVYFILFSKYILNTGTYLNIPLTNIKIEMGNWYYTIVVLIIISTTNAVNLTDGLDGLATGASSIVLAVFSFIAFLEWSVPDVSVSYAVDVAVVSGGTLAACIGFLWWNTAPAEIFMGDTGSFGLGGLIAAVAIILKQEILLIVIGGLFVIEALSVIIQVLWFKMFKRRVFKMAPIHHHFELLEWPEIKIIIRFWIVCMLFAGIGFFIYYLKFID
ncbi:hypothetical protein A2V94_03540 [Candidatus Atribacteria bacterium RBG_16_35_8]|nr:MAG: hypothetical protein A2V94_03540 [Candidatus Atribacteria bacterium RBG_16_35_8]